MIIIRIGKNQEVLQTINIIKKKSFKGHSRIMKIKDIVQDQKAIHEKKKK